MVLYAALHALAEGEYELLLEGRGPDAPRLVHELVNAYKNHRLHCGEEQAFGSIYLGACPDPDALEQDLLGGIRVAAPHMHLVFWPADFVSETQFQASVDTMEERNAKAVARTLESLLHHAP